MLLALRSAVGAGGEACCRNSEETALKTRYRWEDNIKTGLKEIGWEGVDWIKLAQDRDKRRAVVNVTVIIWVVQNVIS